MSHTSVMHTIHDDLSLACLKRQQRTIYSLQDSCGISPTVMLTSSGLQARNFLQFLHHQTRRMIVSMWLVTYTHTHTQLFNSLWSVTTRVGRYQKKHSPTHTHPDIGHPLSYSSIYNDPWHPLCSVYELDSPLGQPLSRSSLVFLLALDPQLHTPCISSPNHHHIFAAHAHTNSACFAAIPMLCHLYLVSLSAPYLGVIF